MWCWIIYCVLFSVPPWTSRPSGEGGDMAPPPLWTGSDCQGTGRGGCIVVEHRYMPSFKGGKWQRKGVVCILKGRFQSFPVWVISKSGYVGSIEQKGEIGVTPSWKKVTFHPTLAICHLFQKLFQRDQPANGGGSITAEKCDFPCICWRCLYLFWVHTGYFRFECTLAMLDLGVHWVRYIVQYNKE